MGGSVALALHGIAVECADLDIITRAGQAAELASRLGGVELASVGPRTHDRVRGHLGRIRLEGVEVEILGGVENELSDGSWKKAPPIRETFEWVPLDRHVACPVITLSAMRDAYVAMGRNEKVALIDAGAGA